MEPDHMAKRFRSKRSISTRRKREAPYVIYPEILCIVDYDGYRLHGGDNVQIKRYFVSFWNGVDLRYKLLKGPKIRISIAETISFREETLRLIWKEIASVEMQSIRQLRWPIWGNIFSERDDFRFMTSLSLLQSKSAHFFKFDLTFTWLTYEKMFYSVYFSLSFSPFFLYPSHYPFDIDIIQINIFFFIFSFTK